MWKCGKGYLRVIEGLDAASPKGVIRCLRELGIFNDEQTELILTMADDRNMTTHAYDEVFASEIARRICVYDELLAVWYERITNKL